MVLTDKFGVIQRKKSEKCTKKSKYIIYWYFAYIAVSKNIDQRIFIYKRITRESQLKKG